MIRMMPLVMSILLLPACKPRSDAPKDLDALYHYLWLNYEEGTDEDLLAAAANLDPLISEAGNGLLTLLTDDEQATVDVRSGQDPAEATGWFVAGPLACAFDDTERLLYALDQEGLFEDAIGKESYEAYDRVYTSDIDAYVARETPFITWTTTYTVQPLFSTYTAVISGSMRYVAEQDGVGPMVLQRSYLPDLATFDGETQDFFEQDYQLDVVLPASGSAKHGYANWRDLKSAGLEDEDTGVQNLLIDGLETYYKNLDTVCAAGGF